MINQFKIINPQAFISIFGNIPRLNNSEMIDLQLKADGPTLLIRLLTKEEVKIKPKRWDKWDVVYVEMSFLGIKNLAINGLGTYNQINQFEIKDNGKYGELEILFNNEMHIKCLFDWAMVDKITPGLIGSI